MKHPPPDPHSPGNKFAVLFLSLLLPMLCLPGCINFDGGATPDTITPDKVRPLSLIFIEETLKRTPENSKVVTDLNYLRSLQKLGHQYAILDVSDTGAALYADQLKKGPPVTVIMQPDGKLLGWGRTPADTNAMNTRLRRYGGLK